MRTKNKGVMTQTDPNRNTSSEPPFGLPCWSLNSPGPPSQGGDTGSSPVGTTNEKAQVKGPALTVDHVKAIPLAAADPAISRTRADFSGPVAVDDRLSRSITTLRLARASIDGSARPPPRESGVGEGPLGGPCWKPRAHTSHQLLWRGDNDNFRSVRLGHVH
jgi:hypothetical protein